MLNNLAMIVQSFVGKFRKLTKLLTIEGLVLKIWEFDYEHSFSGHCELRHYIFTLRASEAAAQCIVIGPVCLFVGLLPR